MQIRMLSLAAGPLGVLRPGEVVEVTDGMGEALIAVGAAQAVTEPVESAVIAQPETATAPVQRKRRTNHERT